MLPEWSRPLKHHVKSFFQIVWNQDLGLHQPYVPVRLQFLGWASVI